MQGSAAFRLATVSTGGGRSFACLAVADRAIALSAAQAFLKRKNLALTAADSMLDVLEDWPANFPVLQRIADALQDGADESLNQAALRIGALQFHAPVTMPRQIFCSGANYKKHVVQIIVAQSMHETQQMSAEERRAHGVRKMDERAANGTPYFFCKAVSAVTGPFDPVVLPIEAKQPDWELELGVVMGKRARRVKRADALDYVAGYTIVNDITSRDFVNRRKTDVPEMGMNWVLSKSSPSFLPVGPYLTPAAFVGDPQQLQITLKLNGETMQDESTSDMIFGVARQIEELSAAVELLPGDLICTGSPAGNGMHYGRFLRAGDVMEGSITGLGTQRNTCVAEGQS